MEQNKRTNKNMFRKKKMPAALVLIFWADWNFLLCCFHCTVEGMIPILGVDATLPQMLFQAIRHLKTIGQINQYG